MRRRTYVGMSAFLTGAATGGLAYVMAASFGSPHAVVIGASFALAGAILGGMTGLHEHRKRWAKLRLVARVCRTLGFQYRDKVPKKELDTIIRAGKMRLDLVGNAATDWMQGVRAGESVLVFRYDISSGKEKTQTSGQTVVFLPESGNGLPTFSLRPRVFLKDFLGSDISFDPEMIEEGEQREAVDRFGKLYVILSEDEAAVRRIFTADVLRQLADRPGWVINCDGQHLLLYRPEKTELVERPQYVDNAIALRRVLAVEQSVMIEGEHLPEPMIVPGKVRGTGYRTAQVVWRVASATGAAAFFGAMIGMRIGWGGNFLVGARNGALAGIAVLVGLVALAAVGVVLLAIVRIPFTTRPDPSTAEPLEDNTP